MIERINNLSKESAKFFYIGDDSIAWTKFKELLDLLFVFFNDPQININEKECIENFIIELNSIEKYKIEKNYTIIADLLFSGINCEHEGDL